MSDSINENDSVIDETITETTDQEVTTVESSEKDCFNFNSCELEKEISLHEEYIGGVRILKVKFSIANICPNSELAVAVILRDCETNECVTQKGLTIYTPDTLECDTITNEVQFVLVGKVCGNSKSMYTEVISNYMCKSEPVEEVLPKP